MAEQKTVTEQATGTAEKIFSEQTARLEAITAEVVKMQSKTLAQAGAYFEDVSRIAREQVAFADQIGSEWRKLVLAQTKSATQLFGIKA